MLKIIATQSSGAAATMRECLGMLSSGDRVLQVPCSFIYGEHDWMKPENGQRVLASVEKQRGKLSPGDLQVQSFPGQ